MLPYSLLEFLVRKTLALVEGENLAIANRWVTSQFLKFYIISLRKLEAAVF